MPAENHIRPRVGVPWRSSKDEDKESRAELDDYIRAVEKAGAEAVIVSLKRPEGLAALIPTLDAFVLPGSGADIEPVKYGAADKGLSAPPDVDREQTDRAILKHAFAKKKPVLAICYGCQLLNVYLGGTLIQDVRSETRTEVAHRKQDVQTEAGHGHRRASDPDPQHSISIDAGSRLAKLAGGDQAVVNSSHHQAIEKAGRNLRMTAHASDGIAEAVEWTGDANWVLGVQWHPERMPGDGFAENLFRDFAAAARAAATVKT